MSKDEGTAIQLVKYNKEDKTYTFKKRDLKRVIEDNGVENLPLVVISVAGLFRKGKSFLLNFFLRYLYAENKDKWLVNNAEPLKGFNWRAGSERHTEGIHIWNKVFKLPTADGRQVAVILMDTQGTFDGKSSNKTCTSIFALSTLVSSVQIYNLSQHINENDLENLEWFTEFAKFVQDESNPKPFQSLIFLLRDWACPDEYSFGEKGGNDYLANKLKVSSDQDSGLRNVRTAIQSAFEKLSCFLLPYPGKKVATKKNFKGNLGDIEEEFIEHIQDFVPSVLGKNTLIVKSINDLEFTCSEYVELFSTYMKHYNSDELPNEMSRVEAAAEAYYVPLLKRCLNIYKSNMDKILEKSGKDIEGYTVNVFADIHEKNKALAVGKFGESKRFRKDLASKYFEKLPLKIEKLFPLYEEKRKILYNQAAEKHYNSFLEKCLNEYNNQMLKVLDGSDNNIDDYTPDGFAAIHEKHKENAVNVFNADKRFSKEIVTEYTAKLVEKLEVSYLSYENRRDITFRSSSEKYYRLLMEKCLEEYNQEMVNVSDESDDKIQEYTPKLFEEMHEKKKTLASNKFNGAKQYNKAHFSQYFEYLLEKIQSCFMSLKEKQEKKYKVAAEKHYGPLLEKCLNEYNIEMLKVLDGSDNNIDDYTTDGFAAIHEKHKENAVNVFNADKRFSKDDSTECLEKLHIKIQKLLSSYGNRRKSKFKTVAETFYKKLKNDCLVQYKTQMEHILGECKDDAVLERCTPEYLAGIHKSMEASANNKYNEAKIYVEEIAINYFEKLQCKIQQNFLSYEEKRKMLYHQAAEKHYDQLLGKCLKGYNNEMLKIFNGSDDNIDDLTDDGFAAIHEEHKKAAINDFHQNKRFSDDLVSHYLTKLQQKIVNSYSSFKDGHNYKINSVAERHYALLSQSLLKEYNKEMLKVLNGSDDSIDNLTGDGFAAIHNKNKKTLITTFHQNKRFSDDVVSEHLQKLEEKLQTLSLSYENIRKCKLTAATEKYYERYKNESLNEYKIKMDNAIKKARHTLSEQALNDVHNKHITSAINNFNGCPRYSEEIALKYANDLRTQIAKSLSTHKYNWRQSSHDYKITGHPIQLVTVTCKNVPRKDGDFNVLQCSFNKDKLQRMIKENGVQDLPVVVISVAGAFRKGKSFLLNFFLRYLDAENKDKWLDNLHKPLHGFESKGGAERHTEGIHIWDKIFKLPTADGRQVAVILMDTQGTSDGKSSNAAGSMIFALSTLVSSVQIYNLSQQINEDDLQNLDLFKENAKMIRKGNKEEKFQSLMFLLRDWEYPYEYAYGEEGGKDLLAEKLEITSDQDSSLSEVRKYIKLAFEKLSCFLLPPPGAKVETSKHFDGNLNDVDEEFIEHIKCFVPSVLGKSRLILKKSSGQTLSCEELVELFSKSANSYNDNVVRAAEAEKAAEIAAAENRARVAAEAYYRKLVEKYLKKYDEAMTEVLSQSEYKIEDLESVVHKTVKEKTIETFNGEPKFGGKVSCSPFITDLSKQIERSFSSHHQPTNDRKPTKGFWRKVGEAIAYVATVTVSYVKAAIAWVFNTKDEPEKPEKPKVPPKPAHLSK